MTRCFCPLIHVPIDPCILTVGVNIKNEIGAIRNIVDGKLNLVVPRLGW